MRRTGFTLIEMLVTVSVFGLALATLLGGLRVGADSQLRVERLIDRNFEERVALSRIRDDLVAAALEVENEAISFRSEQERDEILAFFRSTFEGGLQHVRYALEPVEGSNDGRLDLVRRTAPVALDVPLLPYSESIVLHGLETFTFSFHDGTRWHNTWDTGGVLPGRVRIRGRQVSGGISTPIEMTVRLPAAAYFGGAQ